MCQEEEHTLAVPVLAGYLLTVLESGNRPSEVTQLLHLTRRFVDVLRLTLLHDFPIITGDPNHVTREECDSRKFLTFLKMVDEFTVLVHVPVGFLPLR